MRKMIRLFAGLMMLTMFLTACQPTPEEEFVQTKNDGQSLAEKIEEVEVGQDEYADLENYDYEYEKEYKCGNKLTVRANINAGNSDKLSVLSVKEKNFQSGDQIRELLEKLYPGYEFYEYRISADQYFDLLMTYQKLLECEKKGEPWIVDGERIDGVEIAEKYLGKDEEVSNLENLEALVEQYTKYYQKALNEGRKLTDFKLKEVDGMSKQVNIQAV